MLINILSNVWFNFILTETQANRNANDQLLDLKKLQEVYGFTKIINFDNDFKFWWIHSKVLLWAYGYRRRQFDFLW